jgi:hypothetical protein
MKDKNEYTMSELVKGMFVFWWLDEGAPPLVHEYFDEMMKTETQDEYCQVAKLAVSVLETIEKMPVGDHIVKIDGLLDYIENRGNK